MKKKEFDHPILRALIRIFAPDRNLSRNPPKGTIKKRQKKEAPAAMQGVVREGRWTT